MHEGKGPIDGCVVHLWDLFTRQHKSESAGTEMKRTVMVRDKVSSPAYRVFGGLAAEMLRDDPDVLEVLDVLVDASIQRHVFGANSKTFLVLGLFEQTKQNR